jgi:hypothetical protein
MRSDDRQAPRMEESRPANEAPAAAPPMTLADQRRDEERAYFVEERRKLDQVRAASKSMEGDAAKAGKWWELRAIDPNAPEFMHSDRAARAVINAATEQVARRMAMQRANDPSWEDPEKVVCREYQPAGPEILIWDTNG